MITFNSAYNPVLRHMVPDVARKGSTTRRDVAMFIRDARAEGFTNQFGVGTMATLHAAWTFAESNCEANGNRFPSDINPARILYALLIRSEERK